MKKILIFRSASYNVIFNLLDYIFSKYDQVDIYIVVQKESVEILQIKYPNITYIVNDDGFFKYKDYLKNTKLRNKIEKRVYDEVYIPSSTENTNGFYEIECIVSEINKKRAVFYNCLGEMKNLTSNKYGLKIKTILLKVVKYIQDILCFLLFRTIYYGCLLFSSLISK